MTIEKHIISDCVFIKIVSAATFWYNNKSFKLHKITLIFSCIFDFWYSQEWIKTRIMPQHRYYLLHNSCLLKIVLKEMHAFRGDVNELIYFLAVHTWQCFACFKTLNIVLTNLDSENRIKILMKVVTKTINKISYKI